MLSVGIHENVIVSKAYLNEQGTLEIELTIPGSDDALAALSDDVELSPDQSITIRNYPINVDYFGESRDGNKMLKLITGFKGTLLELLKAYIANPVLDASKGLKITKDNVNVFFTDQENADAAYKNIVTQFIGAIEPFLGTTPLRMKLPRRSKKSNYPALPQFGPWVESMEIPAEASQIRWTNWEIENGKNSSAPAVDSVSAGATAKDLEELDTIFTKSE